MIQVIIHLNKVCLNPTLYYIHDPMCSWCWGYRPVWDNLQKHLPPAIHVEYVVGGLAPDSDLPMPIEMQHTIQGHWRNIQTKLGTQFNFEFWKVNEPRRSTYMACRAVLAAKSQGFEIEMIDAIQRGYYLQALNPSNIEILNQMADELCALQPERDLARFSLELLSSQTQQELERQIQKARLLTNQGFPSLVLEVAGQHHALTIDYNHYQNTLADIVKLTK